ncbi:hypothetical protein [Micrococcus luteus]|uniref:hypothetical protein n=1 Tax=Micrococcus luteus TaxID=1270 RepID=UPI003019998F
MSHNASPHEIEAQLKRVSTSLFEGVSAGIELADRIMSQIPNSSQYAFYRTHTVRIGAREHWSTHGIGQGWYLSGNANLQAQTILINPDQGLSLRFLRERRRSYPGGVPVAGTNQARREAWTQQAFDLGLLGGQGDEEPVEEVLLLLLWDITDDSQIKVRVVHPTAPGVYGQAVPIDMNFEIETGGTLFSRLSYRGDDQYENFFLNIDQEDNEGNGTNGVIEL